MEIVNKQWDNRIAEDKNFLHDAEKQGKSVHICESITLLNKQPGKYIASEWTKTCF